MQNEQKIRANSFFAGIGGFDLGLESVGIKTVFQCEIDSFAVSVLERHWPSIKRSSDISLLDPVDVPLADVWTGGFPCQDVSLARGGRGREGLKGKNSGLFYPFVSLVAKHKPTVVVIENVAGLLNSHKGRDFHIILSKLTELGYGVAWRLMNTRYYGAPQSRPRLYLVAWLHRPDLACRTLYEDHASAWPEKPRLGFIEEDYDENSGAYVPRVSYCLAATSGRHTGTDWSRSYVSYDSAVRRLTPAECEGLQGFPAGWSYPKDDYHLTHDEIDTLRYCALGNAVSVPVITWIGRRLKSYYPRQFDAFPEVAASGFCADRLAQIAPDLGRVQPHESRLYDEPEVQSPIRWCSGGVAVEGAALHLQVSPSPVHPIPSRFADVLEASVQNRKYYLSPNAAKGILRRVDSQGRTLFRPMDSALRKLAVAEGAATYSVADKDVGDHADANCHATA